jgi:multidrug resistance protein, MATE family
MMSGNAKKELLQLAMPIASSGVLNELASMLAVVFLGYLGKDQLAASALAFCSFLAPFTIAVTLFFSIGILCSHTLGNGDKEKEIGCIVRTGMCTAILIGLPLSLFIWHLGSVLQWCQQDPHLITITIPYFHLMALGLIPTMLNTVIIQFFIGISRSKIALYKTLISLPFIILFSYILILGKVSLPPLGLGGIAITMTAIQTLSFFFLVAYLYFDNSLKCYRLFDVDIIYSTQIAKKIIKIGSPIGIQFGAELAAITAATYFLGHFGVNALAAGQIVAQYITLLILIILGLSQTLSVLTSKAYAKNDFTKMTAYKKASFQLVTYFFVFVAIMFVLFPKILIMPYIDISFEKNSQIVSLGCIFFYIAAFSFYIDALRNMIAASLRGLHLSALPMIISTLCLWGLSVPISYLLGTIIFDNPALLRIGFISGFIVSAFILNGILHKKILHLRQSLA